MRTLTLSGFAPSELSAHDVRRWTFAITAFAILIQILLVWSVNYPPLHDAPNHMARHYLEAGYLFTGWSSPFYAVEYKTLPNLGGDLVIPPLAAIFSPVVALKIFLSLALILYWLGPALFIWQYGNHSPGSMAASLLLLPLNMSSAFFWGFLNYYTGVGLAFLVLVHFGVLTRERYPGLLGLILHTALVVLLFFWHLAAVLIYAIVMASYNAAALWQGWRANALKDAVIRVTLLSLPMLPVFALYAVYAQMKSPQANYWGTWLHKLSLPFVLFRSYSSIADAIVILLWLLAAVAFFGFFVWRGRQALWLWIAIAAFAALALLVPVGWGSTYNADARVVPPLAICLLAAAGRCDLHRFALGAGILVLAVLVRYGSVYYAWSNLDARLTSISAVFSEIPPGSRIMPVTARNVGVDLMKEMPENSFASWLVPLRGAFDPGIFAYADQQPLVVKRDVKIYAQLENDEIVVDDQPTRANYDFVWIFNPKQKSVHIPAGFEKIFSTDDVTVWRVPK